MLKPRLPLPFTAVVAAALLASLLAGCGAGAGTAPPVPEDALGTPADGSAAQPVSETGSAPPGGLVVLAASSLSNAFDQIALAFEAAHPGVDVVVNYGSSSQLAAQLVQGAQADVFASANERQMGVAVEAGRIAVPTATFATNRLALITPAGNPAGLASVQDLAWPGVRLVMTVPGVPARDYADQLFASLSADPEYADPGYGEGYHAAVLTNLVSEESNVRLVAAKVALGEADAGIVYRTDITPEIADAVYLITIPDEYNVLAAYPVGVVSDAPHPGLAQAFVDFILSGEGQVILTGWGFGAAPGD
jgi:molybdate transport system substrate-binding protein